MVRRPGQPVGGRPGLEEDDSLVYNREDCPRITSVWMLEYLTTVSLGVRATVSVGDWATVSLGVWATVSLEDWATVSLEDWATVSLGNWAIVSLGDWATASLGDWAIVSLGDWAFVTLGTEFNKEEKRWLNQNDLISTKLKTF